MPTQAPKTKSVSGYLRADEALRGVYVSEKASRGERVGSYVFEVAPTATKPEIRDAVQRRYQVRVERLRVVNVSGKHRRFGRADGQTADYKKAYLKLAKGQSISFGAKA